MRVLAYSLAAALAVSVAGAQEKKADPSKPVEVKVPDGVSRGVTVEGLTEYKLKNGLRVLLLPDPSRPKVTINCTILVGSRHEGYGEAGMAHLLEHMVFKTCKKFPSVTKALSDHGADFNGTTWYDRTNYFETMPATDDNLEFGIELEADRLMNTSLTREELLKEFSVVRNEFESGENNPTGVLSTRMWATAFEWHNYGKDTIGNKSDIERVPVDRLQAFYKKYYRPDNALLIVAGAFDPSKALALAAKHFGPLTNPEEKLPATYTEEPAQDGERLVTLRRVGKVGAVGAAYHVPAAAHPDFAAVQVLSRVLADPTSGRLYKALVEAKLASSVSGSATPFHDPGLLHISAQTDPANTEKARDVLVATLESLAKQPVTADEVERVKRQWRVTSERSLSDSQRFAISLSEWAAAGDWRLYFLHRDRLEKVTADDVNKAAAKYLVRSNRTVGVYIPTTAAERAEVPATPNVAKLVEGYTGREAVAAGEAFDPTPENIEKRVKRGDVGEGVKYAVLAKKTRGETVQLNLTLRVGNLDSLKGTNAAFNLLGPLMMTGTKSKSRQQIRDELDKLNATVSVFSFAGQVGVRVQAKRDTLPAVLTLVGEILREPAFPASEFDLLKAVELERVEKRKTEPESLASNALRRKLSPYPKDDVRYVPTADEEAEQLKACTLDDVKKVYAEQVGGGAGELAIVGDCDTDAAVKQVGGILKGWTSKTPYKRIEREVKPVAGEVITIQTPDKANAQYVAGLDFELKDSDTEYAALTVGNYLLGAAPLSSRLNNRIRTQDGLSYGVWSSFFASAQDKDAGFTVSAITNPLNIGKVDAAAHEELAKFIKDGVSATELEDAKKAWLASRQQMRASDTFLASQLANGLRYGRTMTYHADLEKRVESLQPADVKAAFEKFIDPKKLVVIKAGDFQKKEEK